MDSQIIRALGHLLSTYEGDLKFFREFTRFSNGEITEEKWSEDGKGTYNFKHFIIGYKVIRNSRKGKALDLLRFTNNWFVSGKSMKVDELADKLKESDLTHNKRAASLASKIMFLMNPQEIIPMDQLNRKALSVKRGNLYEDFIEKLKTYKQEHHREIQGSLEKVGEMLEAIETPFKDVVPQLDLIRENRFLDKWLWIQGTDM